MNQVQTEARFAKQVDEILKNIRPSYFFTVQQRSIRGHPDRIGVVNGFYVALELKRSKHARKAKLQEYNLQKIRSCGGYAEFCYPENVVRVTADLRQIAEGVFDWIQYRQSTKTS